MSIAETDWNQRYRDAETPWDSGKPSEALIRIVETRFIRPCRVLELGCGTGTNAIYLAQNKFQVTAVDLSHIAIAQAKEKAKAAGAPVTFFEGDVTHLKYDGEPFPFVFDRGTYHIVRSINLEGFQKTLTKVVEPGGYYVVLAGNHNEDGPEDKGPPRVSAQEICKELEFEWFDLISLEETHFHGIRIAGEEFEPLAWKAVLRRRTKQRK